LSIVDQIVSSHGGEFLIESEPGRGTTVTIVLPVLTRVSAEEIEEQAANDEEMETSLTTDIAEDLQTVSEDGPDAEVAEAASV
jgi:light-regulated signal transduction histidine kinase (bacteriophytochrome)